MVPCNDYFMIDALAGGEVIRERKYRRESTALSHSWYDYDGNLVTDATEITRLDGLATKHRRVDDAYDDHAVFMAGVNYVDSLVGIPMDKHMVVVEWNPDTDQGFVSMEHPEGLNGDSYYVVVINVGTREATMYTPVDDEPGKDETVAPVDSDNVSVGGSYVTVSPKQAERIRITYRDGKWYYELVTKVYPSDVGGIRIGDVDFVTFRYMWESSSGRDLDTMTEALDSNIPALDNKAVGYAGPGNSDSAVTSILKWGGDNTGSGKECVWMSIKDLRANYYDLLPDVTHFMAYATWFGERGNGKCSFELKAYKGGEMTQDGYNFVNNGGEVVYQNTYDFTCNTHQGASSYKTSYQQVARISYDKRANEVYMSIGEAIKEEDNVTMLEAEIETIKTRLTNVEDELAVVRDIAEGKNSAYVFQDEAEMNEFLANPDNTAKLRVGDSFWLVDLDVPDYWWDGTAAQIQEGPKIDLTPYATIGYVNAELEKRDKLIQQAMFINLASDPTSTTLTYTEDGETLDFTPGAVARVPLPDGSYRFWKLADLTNGVATWVKLIDTRYGNVTLEQVYSDDYEIVNVTSGNVLNGIQSDADDIKIFNSAVGNVTINFNQSVASGVSAISSPLATTSLVLTPGSSASFTRSGNVYKLSALFGVTIFPDLADANREGEWAMTVSKTGVPALMEVVDMRKWDESIVAEQTIDQLNERFPDARIGFAVVCKTINKVYEKVNGYNEWVSYDITSIS